MKFIRKMVASLDIDGAYARIYDIEKYVYSEMVNGGASIDKVNQIYDYGVTLLTESKQRISTEYNLEELGLQKKLGKLDEAVDMLMVRKQLYINKLMSNKTK